MSTKPRLRHKVRTHVHALHDPDTTLAQKIFRPPNTLAGQKIILATTSDHVWVRPRARATCPPSVHHVDTT